MMLTLQSIYPWNAGSNDKYYDRVNSEILREVKRLERKCKVLKKLENADLLEKCKDLKMQRLENADWKMQILESADLKL